MPTANSSTDNHLVIDTGRRTLNPAYAVSLGVAGLMALASVIGLLNPKEVYPTEALQQFALANDVVNLSVAVPMLVGSMWLAWRGQLIGHLFWPGALMYVLYIDLAYVFSMPIGWIYLAYLAVAAASVYTLIGLVASVDARTVQQQLSGRVHERLSGGVLIVLGSFVFLRVFGVIANALTEEASLSATQLSVLLSDVLISPAWIIGGVLLWKQKPLGYAAGLGLLFQSAMLFVGLILFLILQPWLTNAPFALIDIIVVAIMGLICFVPLAFFLRATVSIKQG